MRDTATRGNRLLHLGELLRPPAHQHDMGAGAREILRKGPPDALAGAGDDDQPIVEPEGGQRVVVEWVILSMRAKVAVHDKMAVPRGVEPPTFGLGNRQTVNRIYAERYSNAKIVDRQRT